MFFKKRKGYALLITAALSSIIIMLVAQGLATVYSSQFSTLEASRTALQTLQHAEGKASELRVVSYSDLASQAQARAAIPSTTFEREVLVGAETDLGGGNKQKIATVNIYKPGESQPRFTLEVPLTSQGSGTGVPVGTIIWYPASTPPQGFLVCNGQSTAGYPALASIVGANVPDLRGEFIRGLDLGRGVDSGRMLGSIQGDAIRNITATIGYFYSQGSRRNTGAVSLETSTTIKVRNVDGDPKIFDSISFDASRVVPTANENRPRNIALLPCIKY